MKRTASLLFLTLLVALTAVDLWILIQRSSEITKASARHPAKPKIPRAILVSDFQRPLDGELMAWLREAESSSFVQALDINVVKPLVDDVGMRSAAVDGLEVSASQFTSLHAIVVECATVLHMDKIPRVFITHRSGRMIVTENYSEPFILIHPHVIRRFSDPVELRFLIGRELGHAKAGHVRWQSVLRKLQTGLAHVDIFGLGAGQLPLLPLLRWSREAEMTADNAGIVCAQDAKVAERVLVRLSTGIDALGEVNINVDAYLAQTKTAELSRISELASMWQELNRPAPFNPERIRQLRVFSRSPRYEHLWE